MIIGVFFMVFCHFSSEMKYAFNNIYISLISLEKELPKLPKIKTLNEENKPSETNTNNNKIGSSKLKISLFESKLNNKINIYI